MDLLKFIKNQRLSNVSFYALLSDDRRKFAKKIAESIISEYSSPSINCSSSDNYKDKDYDYVDSLITSEDPVS